MSLPRLARRHHDAPPALTLWGEVAFPLARVHEICGRARRTLALRLAAATEGTILWIAPSHARDPLNPDGAATLCDPGRMIFVTARRTEDLLWALEESLRAGVVPLAVAELPEPPGLTPVRRLQLAAEAGTGVHGLRPLGMILTPGAGGAPGVETRTRMEPDHAGDAEGWRVERLRARMAPPRAWRIDAEGTAHPTAVPEPA